MYNLEDFERIANRNGITVVYLDCSNKPLKAFIINIESKFYIMIDSRASIKEKEYMLAYELAHFFTKTFYNANDTEQEKLNKENIANAYMRKEFLKDEK